MFCSKCGRSIPDGYEFCMKCGTKIDLDILKEDLKEDLEHTIKPLKKTRLKIIVPTIVFFTIVILLGSYFVFFSSPKVEGRYYNFCTDDGYLEFTVDKTSSYDGTYIEKFTNDSNYKINGVWKIEDGYIILSDYLLDETLTICKNYLVYSEFTCKGKIPNGKTFDTKCVLDNGEYAFSSDGKMTYTKDGAIKAGTYERNGDIISFKYYTDTKALKLMILKDGINDSVYYKK